MRKTALGKMKPDDIITPRQKACRAFPWIFLILFSGCAAVGPDYVKPDIKTPAAWHAPLAENMTAGQTDRTSLVRWWDTLGDPALTALIETAAAGNLDLKQALSRVREARARRKGSRAALFPVVDASGLAKKNRSSEDSGSGNTSELYSAGFDAGWELDVFGGVRRSIEASQADLEASRAAFQDVMISLLAEVAANYIDVRTYQARLAVSEANVASQQETWALLDALYRAGSGGALAAEQARYNLESSRSRIPDLKTGLEEAMNRLAVLTGQAPGSVHDALAVVRPLPDVAAELAVGVPADLLRRRPDVRQAERNLAAETARVGVAVADLYPRFTLNGAIGLDALSLGNLVQAGSRTWMVGPAVSWRVFDAGAIRSNIEIQSAIQEQALLAYETAVLNALEEVENALVAYAQEQKKLTALTAATRSAKSAVELAGHQYTSGIIGFTDVLDAQRSLLSFEDETAKSRGTVLADIVRLYKTLGGGWHPVSSDSVEPQPHHLSERP